jgi:hypothetical protein
MVPLAEFTRTLRALPYWLNRGADDAITAIAERLARANGPLFPEEIRRLVEPILLAHLILGPALRTAGVPAPIALSTTAAAALREGLALALEAGAAEFDKLAAVAAPSCNVKAQPRPRG